MNETTEDGQSILGSSSLCCLSRCPKGDKDVIFPLFRRFTEGAGHLILEPLLSMHFLMVALCQDITRAKRNQKRSTVTANFSRQSAIQ
jgi:hypothetical protein